MRILHLDTGRTFRGGQQQALFLMQGLRSKDCQQSLFCPSESPLLDHARALGFTAEPLEARSLGGLRGVLKVRKFLTDSPPELIHCHDARAHDLVNFANRKGRLPVVVSRRVAYSIPKNRFMAGKYFAPRQRFIAVSQFVKEQMIAGGIDGNLIDVVYDSVPIDEPKASESISKPRANGSTFRVGALSALESEKGMDVLIRAFRLLKTEAPDARCVIAGEGSEKQRLKNLIRKHHLEGTVMLIPFPESPVDFVRQNDLLVVPSRREGLGSVILLAMKGRVPVLASNTGGIPELIQPARTGFLFSSESVEDLASHISFLVGNLALRQSMVTAAYEMIQKKFSIEVMTEATWQAYQRLLHPETVHP